MSFSLMEQFQKLMKVSLVIRFFADISILFHQYTNNSVIFVKMWDPVNLDIENNIVIANT